MPSTPLFKTLLATGLFLAGTIVAPGSYAGQGVAEGPYHVNAGALDGASTADTPSVIHRHTTPSESTPEAQRVLEPAPFAPQVQSTDLSPQPLIDFEGHSQTNLIPPDTNGAVSEDFVLSVVNSSFNVRDRNGNIVMGDTDLADFFAPLDPGTPFDPRARFDRYAGRFIIMAASNLGMELESKLLLAVSQSDDPTGDWNLYSVPADPDQSHWLDYPTIGYNTNWIVVSGNMFPTGNESFTTRLWAFDKADLYAGDPADFTVLPGVGSTAQPAETYDPDIEELYLLRQDSNSSVALHRLNGPIGSESTELVASVDAPEPWTGFLPPAPEQGTDPVIPSGLNRMMNAVFRNGHIWGAHPVEPTTEPSRVAAQWWRIDTEGQLVDFGRVDDPTGEVFYGWPSISVNADNDALIGYTRFSATTFPSAGYAFRDASDPPGTFREGVVYESGMSLYTQDRWGDYSRTLVDPVNDMDFWTAQEISAAVENDWVTWWAHVSPEGEVADVELQLKSGSIGPTNSPHPALKVINQSETSLDLGRVEIRYWFDCDCDPATTTLQGWVDWAGILPGGQAITSDVEVSFEPADSGGQTHAMVVGFTGSAPALGSDEEVNVDTRFNKADWSGMVQENDWSYAPFQSYTTWDQVTVYVDGTLIWGMEP